MASNTLHGNAGHGVLMSTTCPAAFELGPGNVVQANAAGDVVDRRPRPRPPPAALEPFDLTVLFGY